MQAGPGVVDLLPTASVAMAPTATSVASAMQEQIAAVLSETQLNMSNHRKNMKALTALYKKQPVEFFQGFMSLIHHPLSVFRREPSVERVIKFIAGWLVSCAGSDPVFAENFLPSVLEYLVKNMDVDEQAVRFRACQLVSNILHTLPEETDLSEELILLLESQLLERMRDKVAVVRFYAAEAASRLINPDDPRDRVTAQYMLMLETDPSRDVRKIIVQFLPPVGAALAALLMRTRDVSEQVRKYVFVTLQQKCRPDQLSAAQRAELLRDGLTDRSATVRQHAGDLLASWLEACGNDFGALLRLLDGETQTDTAALAIQALMARGLVAEPAVDLRALTSESALLLRVYCSELASRGQDLDDVVPDLCTLCEALSAAVARRNGFVAEQLLHVACCMDLGDEAGRRRLCSTLRAMLEDAAVDVRVVSVGLRLLARLYPNEAEYTRMVCEMVSEIVEPLQEEETAEERAKRIVAEQELTKLVAVVNELAARKATLVAAEDFEGAAAVKQQIDAQQLRIRELEQLRGSNKVSDEAAWARALTVGAELLETTRLRSAAVQGFLPHLIVPALQRATSGGVTALLAPAMRCLALYCLLDVAQARQHCSVITGFLEDTETSVPARDSALRGLFDLALVFGRSLNAPAAAEPDAATDDDDVFDTIVGRLRAFLSDSTPPELQSVAAEGFAKLFASGRVTDPKLLGRLLLLYFDPRTEADLRLRQCLSVFFVTFATETSENRALIAQAFMPALAMLIKAAEGTTLSEVRVTTLVQYFLYLTDPANLQREGESQHASIALTLMREILSGGAGELRGLCRLLSYLNLPRTDQTAIKMLRVLTDQALETMSDAVAKKPVAAFGEHLLTLDDTPDSSMDAAARDELDRLTAEFVQQRTAICASARKTPKRPKRRLGHAAAAVASDTDSDADSAEEDDFVPAPVPVAPKTKAPARGKKGTAAGGMAVTAAAARRTAKSKVVSEEKENLAAAAAAAAAAGVPAAKGRAASVATKARKGRERVLQQ